MKTAARIAETEPDRKAPRAARSGVRGSLRLNFERDEPRGQTVLAVAHQEPPLKVVRAFTIEGGAALVHLHNVSGGLLGGDELAFTVSVGAGSRAQITTTGATRVYRAHEDAATTVVRNEIAVGENALLEYLPDPAIPYAGARVCQRTMIRLAQGAGLFWWEILAPGREARGEIFEYDSFEMKTDILALGRPILSERARLEPKKRDLSSAARLATYRTWASFYICRVGLTERVWLDLESEIRQVAQQFVQPGETLWGISTLAAHGLVVRCVAKQGRHVSPGLHAIWDAAKQRLYGSSAVPPRKVN